MSIFAAWSASLVEGHSYAYREKRSPGGEILKVKLLDSDEGDLRSGGYAPGQRYQHELLRNYQPAFAIARQWAGLERETEMLQEEIGRLRGLVSQVAYDLKALGKEDKARRLLRAVGLR